MPYCNATDVGKRLGVTFSGTTVPTDSVVVELIADGDAEINAVLRKHGFGVSALVDLPDNDSYLRALSACGAAWRAARAMFTGQGYNTAPVVGDLKDEYQSKLARLEADPSLVLNTSDERVVRFAGKPNSVCPPEWPDARYKVGEEY